MMRAEIGTLRIDLDQLRSIDIFVLLGEIFVPDAPRDMPTSVSSMAEQPSAGGTTIGEVLYVDAHDDEEERVEDVDDKEIDD